MIQLVHAVTKQNRVRVYESKLPCVTIGIGSSVLVENADGSRDVVKAIGITNTTIENKNLFKLKGAVVAIV